MFRFLFVLTLGASAEHQSLTAPAPSRQKLRSTASHVVEEFSLQQAAFYALGAGRDLRQGQLLDVTQRLAPIWAALAKTGPGRVDRRSLRYVLHRYFLQTHSLSLVGLEPLQASSSRAEAALLTALAPDLVRRTVEGRAAGPGFSFEDAVVMTSLLEHLVVDSNQGLLASVYEARGLQELEPLRRSQAESVAEGFMLRWMIGEESRDMARELEANTTFRDEAMEHWGSLAHFARAQVSAFEFSRTAQPQAPAGSAWSPLHQRFGTEDMKQVVGSMTMGFGSFWQTECLRIKGLLVDMDRTGRGRVLMKDFHQAALNGEWRFSESQDYLKKLGALDESAGRPQVLIANYLQAASNCIVSTEHYRVCCPNECEAYLLEVEAAVKQPLAEVDMLFSLVRNMTRLQEEGGVRLTRSHEQQLREIASVNDGRVPIHGRLFSQWLHSVFPRECPFPHKAGSTVVMTPTEYGGEYLATPEEMKSRASSGPAEELEPEEQEPVHLWDKEEELLSEQVQDHMSRGSGSAGILRVLGIVLFAAVSVGGAMAAALGLGKMGQGKGREDFLLPLTSSAFGKTHCL